MVDCIGDGRIEIDKDIIEREKELGKIEQRFMKEQSPVAEFIRAELGMHFRDIGIGEDGLFGVYRSWVFDEVGIEIGEHESYSLPTRQDTARLKMLLDDAENKFDNMVKYVDKVLAKHDGDFNDAFEAVKGGKHKLIGMGQKVAPLTKRYSFRKLPLGQRLYDNVLQAKGQHEARTETMQSELNNLMKSIIDISGARNDAEIKRLGKIDAEISRLEMKQEGMKQMADRGTLPEESGVELVEVTNKLRGLNAERVSKLNNYEDNPATAFASKLIDVIEHKDFVKRKKTATAISKEMAIKPAHIENLADGFERFFKKMVVIGEETAVNSAELIEMHLERLRVSPEDRQRIIDSTAGLDFAAMEKGYFPRMEIGAGDGFVLEQIVNMLDDANIVESKSITGDVTKLVESYMKHRSAEAPSSMRRRNRNAIDVAVKYTTQMLHTNLTTKMLLEMERPAMVLGDILSKLDGFQKEIYLEAWQQQIERLRADVIGTASHGVAASLSRSVLATTTGLKLGGLNIPGIIRNTVDGMYIASAAAGWTAAYKLVPEKKKNNPQFRIDLERYQSDQQRALAIDKFWNPEKGAMHDRESLIGTFGEELADAGLGVRLQNRKKVSDFAAILEKGTGAAAQALMTYTGWKKGENIPRKFSSDTGAAMGLMIAEEDYLPMFIERRLSSAHAKKFGLNIKNANSGDEELWRPEYEKLAKKMTNDMGFEIMAGSQWIYDAQERHWIESFEPGGVKIGKAIAMFQHYPVSWNTAMLLATQDIYKQTKAGGFRAGFGATTKEKRWAMNQDYAFNPKLTFMLSMAMMLTAGIIAEKEKAYGRKIGYRMYGMAQNPVLETIQGFAEAKREYGAAQKRAFFGQGVVSQWTGPHVQYFIDAMNIAAIELGQTNEEWPEWLSFTLQQTIGFAPNEENVNWDPDDRMEGILSRLQKVVPFVNRGVPIIENQRERKDADVLMWDLLRATFNVTGGRYAPIPEDEEGTLTPEQLLRSEQMEAQNRFVEEQDIGAQ